MNHRALLQARQVCYLSGDQNYTWTHPVSGRRHLRRRTLQSVSLQYPDFLRIHKQYVINPDCLINLYHEPRPHKRPRVEVELRGGVRLPVAQSRAAALLPLLSTICRRNQTGDAQMDRRQLTQRICS